MTTEFENRMEKVPYEFYLEEYKKADPYQMANRLAIPYDARNKRFQFTVLGCEYTVSYPDFQIQSAGTNDRYGLTESWKFRILMLRYLLYASLFEANGNFRAFHELPSGQVYAKAFEERCSRAMANRYGKVLQVFEAVMESVDAVRIYGAEIAYELEFLEGLYIRFLFWSGDEEFEPTCQILFSSNFPAAFSTYELSEIIEICMDCFDMAEPLLAVSNPHKR